MSEFVDGAVLIIHFHEPIDKKMAKLAIPLIVIKNRDKLFSKVKWIGHKAKKSEGG